jgi:hypothetical protein
MIKTFKIIILILCAGFNSFSQDAPFRLNSKYFLLGTIEDYDGYSFDSNDTSYPVTVFLRDEMYKLYLIDSLFKNQDINAVDYKLEFYGIDQHCDQSRAVMQSKALFSFVNSFYKFKILVYENHDKYNYSTNKYELIKQCTGKLKYSIIKRLPKDQLYSFIAGIFFIYGKTDNDKYMIQMGNSKSKIFVIKRLLRKEKSKKMKFVTHHIRGNPYVRSISFIPSEQLKKVLDLVIKTENSLSIRQRRSELTLSGRKL